MRWLTLWLLATPASAGTIEEALVDAHEARPWVEARAALVSDPALSDADLLARVGAADWRVSVTAAAVLAWRRDPDAAAAVWSEVPLETRAGLPMFDARAGAAVPAVLAARLLHGADSPAVRRALVEQIRRSDAAWAPWLVGAFAAEPDASVRAIAVEVLRYADGDDAVQGLRAGLADPDAGVRAAAARGAGWSKAGPAVVPELMGATGDPDHGVAGFAARSLGWLDAGDAFDAIASVLQGPDPTSRLYALRALERLDSARAARHPAVAAARDDADARVARAAGQIVGG